MKRMQETLNKLKEDNVVLRSDLNKKKVLQNDLLVGNGDFDQ